MKPATGAFFVMLGSLSGCTASQLNLAPPSGDEVTLFVPGYQGSFLATETRERAWLTPWQALQRGNESLALAFPGARTPPAYGPLRPEGPMTQFVLIPGLLKVDVYLEWMKFGRDHLPGFLPFSYDWRQDLRQSSAELCRLMDRLVAEHHGKLRINLVAHSMGGLVALHCLRHGLERPAHPARWAGARNVERVVFVGTPFKGSPGIFKDFFRGTATGRNRALMSPEALFTFASAFQLLPPRDDFFVDASGHPTQLEVFDSQSWWTGGWGIFQNPELREHEAYRAQLQRMLAARAGLADALADDEGAPPGFRTLVVTGHGRPVIAQNRSLGSGFDFEHPVLEDGDGTVMARRTLPPKPLEARLIDSDAEHTGLLRDEKVQKSIEDFLFETRIR